MISLVLKNVCRNKKRTLLSGIVIFLAACSMSVMMAIEHGMIDDMTDNIIDGVTGTVRVRNGLYTENERIRPLQFYIPDTESAIRSIRGISGVSDVQPRICVPVTLYRHDKTSEASVLGIDMNTSRVFTGRGTKIIEGRLPDSTQNGREIVICKGLADQKQLKPRDKFTFMTKTATGGMNGITVTVSGIVSVGNSDLNAGYFFMDWKMLSQLLRMNGNVLELQVFTDESIPIETVEREIIPRIRTASGFENAEAVSWKNSSVLYSFLQIASIFYACISAFFFLLSSTVIFVTTMMTVLERKHETGMLMALGMDTGSIFKLFLSETALISFVSSLTGVLCGFVFVFLMNRNGLDVSALGGDAVSGFNYSQLIYPSLDPFMYIMLVVMGTGISTAACIIPVSKVRKTEPAQTLHAAN